MHPRFLPHPIVAKCRFPATEWQQFKPKWSWFQSQIWKSYRSVAPTAIKINRLLSGKGAPMINDHVTFKTFNHKCVDLDVFEQNLSRHHRYRANQEYDISDGKMKAKCFEHSVDPANHPLIFVSEFQMESLQPENQRIIHRMFDSMDPQYDAIFDSKFVFGGRIWDPITFSEHESLHSDSSDASWIAAFGFMPFQFTLSTDHLDHVIDGDVDLQSTWPMIVQDNVEVLFADEVKQIPGARFQFRRRFEMEQDEIYVLLRELPGEIRMPQNNVSEHKSSAVCV